jgi:hypothetical protein
MAGVILYSYLKRKEAKNISDVIFRFFITITATEILMSAMSMPFMFYKHGLYGSVLPTIAIAVTYKIVSNIVITSIYSIFIKQSR